MVLYTWRLFIVIICCVCFVLFGFFATQDGSKIGCQSFALTGTASVYGVSTEAVANFTQTVQGAAANFTQTVQALSNMIASSSQLTVHALSNATASAASAGDSANGNLQAQLMDSLRKQGTLQERQRSLEAELEQLRSEAETRRKQHGQQLEALHERLESEANSSARQHQQEIERLRAEFQSRGSKPLNPDEATKTLVAEKDVKPDTVTRAPVFEADDKKSHFYAASDLERFGNWSQRANHKRLPKVLLYTWATEDTYANFYWENYWKACYAHAHGFDIVFSDSLNFTGVAKWDGVDLGWYSEEHMWAWVHGAQEYMFTGKYDYVFVMGTDTLLVENNLDFPMWQFDTGHDITIMDDHLVHPPNCFGLNENNMLFKPTNFTRQWLYELFEFRKGFYLQGDNGPYMEMMLIALGREAEANGKPGYQNACLGWMTLDRPNTKMQFDQIKFKGNMYYDCFFKELGRLAGDYGGRQSKHIGFSPTYFWDGGRVLLPNDLKGSDKQIYPWANCWSNPRKFWTNIWENCFAFHWNGAKEDPNIVHARKSSHERMAVKGCPDPTFNFETSPYHPKNRKR
mmetsp:Transcript_14361/g.26132  ORF Transcript_14361/g.26132 Transcript_14361/m.26132 type:complete len:572 (-) Transcript_14361:11-1726(-)